MAQHILVVDDSADIRENVCDYLSLRGWRATAVPGTLEAGHVLSTEGADLIVLDVGLPGEDGMSFCRRLREAHSDIPILMLTARDAVDDRVAGLTSGADDYLVKPFSLLELNARIEALLRRANRGEAARLTVGPLVLDLGTLSAVREGEELRLNPTCLKILKVLMKASPRVVSREELESKVWGADAPASDSLRSNLYLLRQALDKPFARHMLRTHPGAGWSIAAPAEENSVGSAQSIRTA